jgi:hypothetical protein
MKNKKIQNLTKSFLIKRFREIRRLEKICIHFISSIESGNFVFLVSGIKIIVNMVDKVANVP